ncbi:MAG: molybdenum cofactor biosynthesis protein MoaE [Thermoplasmataceae archaeon]
MKCSVQRRKIDIDELIEITRNPEAGAIVVFLGTVRKNSEDKEIQWLFYEAYEEMVVEELDRIVKEAMDKFHITDINLIHRLGRLGIKEDSVAICVSSPHRAEAFQACQFVIDEVKTRAPIWKMDITADGEKAWH